MVAFFHAGVLLTDNAAGNADPISVIHHSDVFLVDVEETSEYRKSVVRRASRVS